MNTQTPAQSRHVCPRALALTLPQPRATDITSSPKDPNKASPTSSQRVAHGVSREGAGSAIACLRAARDGMCWVPGLCSMVGRAVRRHSHTIWCKQSQNGMRASHGCRFQRARTDPSLAVSRHVRIVYAWHNGINWLMARYRAKPAIAGQALDKQGHTCVSFECSSLASRL